MKTYLYSYYTYWNQTSPNFILIKANSKKAAKQKIIEYTKGRYVKGSIECKTI